MSNGTDERSSRRSRLTNIILVCSLAVNLLLVGGIIGHIISGPPPRPMPDHLGWMFRSLDETRRQELRAEFESHAQRMRPLRREMREAQRDFERAVRASEFDPDEVSAALERLRSTSGEFQEGMHSQIVHVLTQLDEEERRQLVRFLGRRDRHRPPPGEPQ